MRGVLAEPRSLNCPECNQEFLSCRGNKRFCGQRCKQRFYEARRDAASRRIHEHICEWCEEPYKSKAKTSRFCSNSCKARHGHKSGRLGHTVPPRLYGKEHPNWNGGRVAATLRAQLGSYGLTVDDYEALFDSQGGVCAICGRVPTGIRLAVDHDHATGFVRGLLCRTCNTGIAMFREDTLALLAAVAYLLRGKD